MAKYETHFISQNKVPNGYIGVYNGTELVGKVKADNLKIPPLGNKLYSFGALSDVHVSNANLSKFQKALAYFNNTEGVAFTCIAGDLTPNGKADDFNTYNAAVEPYSAPIPVYEITGNHDVETSGIAPFLTKESTKSHTGHLLYYTVSNKPTDEETCNYYNETVGSNDVFIMFGMSGWINKTGSTFTAGALQWLYETLEANRNKRCFVFEHCPSIAHQLIYLEDGSSLTIVVENNGNGEPYNNSTSGSLLGVRIPTGELINRDTSGLCFRQLMAHYKNIIWFHGHSHMDFYYQEDCSQINYDKNFGCHSVHIPALASGRKLKADGSGWENPVGGYGYVVDVYENHIVLRGRDFVAEKFVPIATFCLDTTPQIIEAGTFTDTTGIIVT